jgi:hypothetical protein
MEENRNFYDVSSVFVILEGIMLSKAGISCNGSDILLSFCKSRETSLSNEDSSSRPKFAIANELWMGSLPMHFHDTSRVEN